MANKTTKRKIASAAEALKAFLSPDVPQDSAKSGDTLTITGGYQVAKASDKMVKFTLQFNNIGVAAVTDAFLHDIDTGDIQKANKERDSLLDHDFDIEKIVDGKFLQIRSIVTATNLTPVPANLDLDFLVTGGMSGKKEYPLPKAKFEKTGDFFKIDILIFFFSL